MIKNIAIILTAAAVIVAVGAYSYYTWVDCLEENGFFTCYRMLK